MFHHLQFLQHGTVGHLLGLLGVLRCSALLQLTFVLRVFSCSISSLLSRCTPRKDLPAVACCRHDIKHQSRDALEETVVSAHVTSAYHDFCLQEFPRVNSINVKSDLLLPWVNEWILYM